jgi:hypothetical protein
LARFTRSFLGNRNYTTSSGTSAQGVSSLTSFINAGTALLFASGRKAGLSRSVVIAAGLILWMDWTWINLSREQS